jgi:hypothetical protein
MQLVKGKMHFKFGDNTGAVRTNAAFRTSNKRVLACSAITAAAVAHTNEDIVERYCRSCLNPADDCTREQGLEEVLALLGEDRRLQPIWPKAVLNPNFETNVKSMIASDIVAEAQQVINYAETKGGRGAGRSD